VSAGVPLPLPPTEEAARLVAVRAAAIRDRYGVPFLLENTAYYLPDLPADPEIGDEFGLMDRIEALSGCRRLLDLHNLYCNALNFGFAPKSALTRIPLDRVLEIHIAGGSWCEGFYMDGHNGRVPGPVWELLELALSRAPGSRAWCLRYWRNTCGGWVRMGSRANWSGRVRFGGATILCEGPQRDAVVGGVPSRPMPRAAGREHMPGRSGFAGISFHHIGAAFLVRGPCNGRGTNGAEVGSRAGTAPTGRRVRRRRWRAGDVPAGGE